MELKQIYELWDRFETSGINDLEIEFQGVKLHMRKEAGAQTGSKSAMSADKIADHNQNQSEAQPKELVQAADANLKEIIAPIVGTFYASPSPDEKPFVEVGQSVKKGDVVGIIEAMKLMNEVVADEDGVVEEILVQDQSFVEYHQVLMKLK